ncbi:MAG: hypothetical protein H7Y16_03135 [Candidatus Parcubacteria bacterium]|nr:hypothetical protein [Burkholderiales bacterium]
MKNVATNRIAALGIALAVLAGCVTPPPYVLETGPGQEFLSNSDPLRLASCTAFNARSFSARYTGQVETQVRPHNYKVIVTEIYPWYFEPIIVAQLTPAPSGSRMVVFLSNALPPAAAGDWIERLRRGC